MVQQQLQNNTTKQFTEMDSERQFRMSSNVEEIKANNCFKAMPHLKHKDVKYSAHKLTEAGLSLTNVREVKEYLDSKNQGYAYIDIHQIAWSHILEQAGKRINQILKFDMLSDSCVGVIGIAGNSANTSFGCSIAAKEQLEKKIQEANIQQIEELMCDKCVSVFLKDVNINIKKIHGIKSPHVRISPNKFLKDMDIKEIHGIKSKFLKDINIEEIHEIKSPCARISANNI